MYYFLFCALISSPLEESDKATRCALFPITYTMSSMYKYSVTSLFKKARILITRITIEIMPTVVIA